MSMDAPSVPPPKKGLSTGAIVGLGCLGVVILIVIVVVGAGVWGYHKVSADDDPKNPDRSAALIALRFVPGVDVVSTDDVKREVTIKNKSTSEVSVLSYDDFKNGKFAEKMKGQGASVPAAPGDVPADSSPKGAKP
jgi:hypothetical protein